MGPALGSGGEAPTVSFVDRPEGQNDGTSAGLELIGKYRVIRRLGSGGQATAILAFDPELERHIVLKRYHVGSDKVGTEQALMEG